MGGIFFFKNITTGLFCLNMGFSLRLFYSFSYGLYGEKVVFIQNKTLGHYRDETK
jgi:hypothetical protein